MRNAARYEKKYRLALSQYYQFKNALMPYIQPDKYTVNRNDGKYFVRSLYFDTCNYEAFHEKENGNCGRIKLRLRTYAKSPDLAEPVSVELKTRKGDIVHKHSVFVSYGEYMNFIKQGHWPDRSSPVLEEFERLFHLRQLRPTTLVQYYREGFKSRLGDNVRITFDHDVSSCTGRQLFPDCMFLRPHHPGRVILEIKYSDKQPVWCMNIVKKCGFKIVANSKYVQSVQVAQPDVVTPSAVQFDAQMSNRIFDRSSLKKNFTNRKFQIRS